MTDIDIRLMDAVIAAKMASDAVLEVYDSDFGFRQKEDKSPLTLADMRSHEIINCQLNSSKAGKLPLLSEEGRDIPYTERKKWDYYWLVDPLDGTKEFIKRNGEFTVNIALMHRDRPVIGVILIPVKDMLYFAAEGAGAFRLSGVSALYSSLSFDGFKRTAVRLPLKSAKKADVFTAIASRSHMSEDTTLFLEGLKKEHGRTEVISAGSSLKFCLIAEGAADIYPRFAPTMEWDTAAGQAIVEQTGGSVLQHGTDLPMRYNKENLLNPWFIVKGPGLNQIS